MRFLIVILTIILASTSTSPAQYLLTHSKPIDPYRYFNIMGSPYLYAHWKYADIIDRDSTIYKHILINYNGYEHSFEAIITNDTVTIDYDLVNEIKVYAIDTTTHNNNEEFIRGVHFDIATQLSNVIYNGANIKLIRNCEVRLVEITDETPGTTLVRNRFARTNYYFILYKSKLYPTRLTAYKLGKILDDKTFVKQTAKEAGLNLTHEQDVIKLLAIFDNKN